MEHDDMAARATDWRAGVRLVGPRRAAWSLPLLDVVLGAVWFYLALLGLSLVASFGPHPLYLADAALGLVVALAQPLRRRAVRTSFVVTAVALALYTLLTFLSPAPLGLSPLSLTALTSLHAVVRWCPDRRWGRAALVAALVGAVVNPLTMLLLGRNRRVAEAVVQTQSDQAGALLAAAAVVIAVLVVLLVLADASGRRRRAEERLRELARERSAAVAAERLELARELHDLLGHGLTAIRVQAATALAVGDQAALRTTLGTVERTAGACLDEVRDLVRALRGATDVTTPPADPDGVGRAILTARQAGLDLTADVPEPEQLRRASASWSLVQRLAVLRAVQEGLTNALRHGTGSATLSLVVDPGRCTVTVANPVTPGTGVDDAAGTGLTGLSERIRLAGGTMSAGPVAEADGEDAGEARPVFRLTVSLPVTAPPRPEEEPE